MDAGVHDQMNIPIYICYRWEFNTMEVRAPAKDILAIKTYYCNDEKKESVIFKTNMEKIIHVQQ